MATHSSSLSTSTSTTVSSSHLATNTTVTSTSTNTGTSTTAASLTNATGGNSGMACYDTKLLLTSTLLDSTGYSAALPPLLNSGISAYLTVTVAFVVIKFSSLTTDTKILKVQGALDMLWTDPNLYWDASLYPCISSLPFIASSVWTPYVFLKGSASSDIRYAMSDDDFVMISAASALSNGRIYGTFASSCSMDLLLYPFDEQVCPLKFLNYNDEWLVWSTSPDSVYLASSDSTSSSDWSVLSIATEVVYENVSTPIGAMNLSIFEVTFNLRRNSINIVMNLIAPTVVLWVMISLTFLLPTDRGMKVPMTVTLMLAIYTQQKTVSTLLPATTPVPYISRIYVIGLYLSALSLITAVLTVLMRVLAPTLPPKVQRFMINVVGRLCCAPKLRVAPESSKSVESADVAMGHLSSSAASNDLALAMTLMETCFSKLDSRLSELIDIKKEKAAKQQAATVNDNAWQKIEFVFNCILLVAYLLVMIILFGSFSSAAKINIL